jgi:hypothetical protein
MKHLPDIENRCEYIAYADVDSLQEMVFQAGDCPGRVNNL